MKLVRLICVTLGALQAVSLTADAQTPPAAATAGPAPASNPASAASLATESDLHFQASAGEPVKLGKGSYQVAAAAPAALRVTDAAGKSFVLTALTGTHSQKVDAPRALVIPVGQDERHLVLLLPDGSRYEAVGSASGIRSRGGLARPGLVSEPMLNAGMQMTPNGPIPQTMPGGVQGSPIQTGPQVNPQIVTTTGPQLTTGPQIVTTTPITTVPGGAQTLPVDPTGAPVIPQPGSQVPGPFQTQPYIPQQQTPALVPTSGPQFGGDCRGPDGRPLPITAFLDVPVTARATGPFSIELTLEGPPATYQISADGITSMTVPLAPNQTIAKLPGGGAERVAPGGRVPAPAGVSAVQQATQNVQATFSFARPQYPILPDFDYRFKVNAVLPDGKLVCDGATAKTMPAPALTPLQPSFVAPNDVRLGFVLPPYANEVNIYRMGYVEDGRLPPSNKQVFQQTWPNASAQPVSFALAGNTDGRVRIDPGLPPLPADYTRPITYDFVVEAVWRFSAAAATKTTAAIRVDGPLPLYGWADLHTHPMSHLAFGGKIFHGAPDVGSLVPALALPPKPLDPRADCFVAPGFRARTMEEALAEDSATHGDPAQSQCGDAIRKAVVFAMELGKSGQPGRRHGAPIFDAWPRHNDVSHQKMWVDWIRRAYDGGLRVMVALSHNNRVLGTLANGDTCRDPRAPCLPLDDRSSSEVQIEEIKAFVARHADFMEVALDSAHMYRIVRGNPPQVPSKMAVILGIELDHLGNFTENAPPRSPDQVNQEIANLYSRGVRYVLPVHLTDNAFGGTAPFNHLFNAVNVAETGHFWQVECAGTPPYANDEIGFQAMNITALEDLRRFLPDPFKTLVPTGVELPKAPANCAAHRNMKGLNTARFQVPSPTNPNIGVGEYAIKQMMRAGMIVDIDHMSHRTTEQVLAIAEAVPGGGYPLMSGHSGIREKNGEGRAENSRTPMQLSRIGCLGGMFGLGTDKAEARNWAKQYEHALAFIADRPASCAYKQLGMGAVAFGTDVNSMVESPIPPGRDVYNVDANRTTRRFPTDISRSGAASWNYGQHGVAHYGMYADFVKDIWSSPLGQSAGMRLTGEQLVDGHLSRNADNFWRMWVKVERQKSKVTF